MYDCPASPIGTVWCEPPGYWNAPSMPLIFCIYFAFLFAICPSFYLAGLSLLCFFFIKNCVSTFLSFCLHIFRSFYLSVFLFFRLNVCLFVWLPVFLFICLSFCLSVCLFVCSCVCLFVCLPIYMPACLSTCLSTCLHTCLFVCLYVCLSGRHLCVCNVWMSKCMSLVKLELFIQEDPKSKQKSASQCD